MDGLQLSKVCRECSRSLPLTAYHKSTTCRDGLQPKCRECVKAYRANYYQKNQDRLKRYSTDFYKERADDVKAYQRTYYEHNTFKVKERNARWRSANREQLLAAKKVDYRKNKDRYSALAKIWRKEHPEYARLSCYNRKARMKQAPGKCTAVQFLAKCEYHGYRCYLCKTPLTIKDLQMDHRTPLARGGSNWPANIAPACGPCNLSKGRKTEAEFRSTMQRHP